mmetsp:Transcript_20333/g.36510  ORF Transcript_20333/g.36510 Transcript_20333/m.36510 type:complete len:207 (-) Transcript_20333:2014-2634(-)
MPFLDFVTIWIQVSLWVRYSCTARERASSTSRGVVPSKQNPFPSMGGIHERDDSSSVAEGTDPRSKTVSDNPPVRRTTGRAPYRKAMSCVNPQGSYRDGTRTISAAAKMSRDKASLKEKVRLRFLAASKDIPFSSPSLTSAPSLPLASFLHLASAAATSRNIRSLWPLPSKTNWALVRIGGEAGSAVLYPPESSGLPHHRMPASIK